MSKEKRLGRGLSALFESEIEEDQVQEKPLKGEMIENISVDQLNPGQYQPRKRFDEESLQELADSIIEQGLMQPIIVRKSENNFEIIAGERRWRAAKLAKLETIPVIVREINDRTASVIALIENMQRVDLSSIEEAEGIKKMIDEFGMTHEEASDAVGKSRSAITNLLRLLQLTDFVKEKLISGDIDMGHARALIPLSTDQQNMVCQKIINEKLSVRKVEDLIQFGITNIKNKKLIKDNNKNSDIQILQKEITDKLGFPVMIENKNNNSGLIKIKYRNLDELDILLNKLKLNQS
ncbi:MAG: ParB/RepB/Spo0J family partition protein [Betaproteobacteria bacterium]|jgi:ParB family chromosome partitioning protein|nr:ParB/RepB/Spo0J family partition protein [Betaproteobacteria bacterium]